MERYSNSIREVGQAVSFTSIILSLGFLIFAFSFHKGLSNFGYFSAIAIISALVADLLLLPALCVLFKLDFNRVKNTDSEAEPAANS